MPIPNNKYWQKRFEELEAALHKMEAQNVDRLAEKYAYAIHGIDMTISSWYSRFARENGISYAEAKKLLRPSELKAFRLEVKEYLRLAKEENLPQEWQQKLDNAYTAYRINRLYMLQLQIQQQVERLFGGQEAEIMGDLREIYGESYLRSRFAIDKGLGFGTPFEGFNQQKVDAVMSEPWAADGKQFSERIWGHRSTLINTLNIEMLQAVIRGDDYREATERLARRMNVSKAAAGRLVMTESAFIATSAQKKCFEDLDVEEYEFIATLDKRTSEICREFDGRHFPLKDLKPGTNAPPLHPHCRSCIAPYFEDAEHEERIARGNDGKTYMVPGNMNYRDWKKVFVDKKMTLEEWRTANDKRKNEHKTEHKITDVTELYLKSATPAKGKIIFDEGYKKDKAHQSEIKMAQWLHDTLGGDIKLLTEAGNSGIDGVKTPDYLWCDKLWELKNPSSMNRIDKGLHDGLKQIQNNPGGVILNVSADLDLKAIEQQIIHRMKRSGSFDFDVILCRNGELKKIFRHKKSGD